MIGGAALREKIEPLLRAMIEELERVVSIDSPTFPPAGTNAVAAHFTEQYSALGAEVERLRERLDEDSGPARSAPPGERSI